MRWLALPAALAAACFSPEARDGLPCSEAGDCPPGQECRVGLCTGRPIADASLPDGPRPDAAPPDAPGPFGAVEHVALTCPTAVPCADVRDPFLANGTTAILFANGVAASAGNYNILLATRASAEGGFLQASSVGAINTALTEHSPYLSGDGATLWFARQDVSSGGNVRPYDQILVSRRPGGVGTFDTAEEVPGAVNTLLGDERSPQLDASAESMLFTRAPEKDPADHDVYLARLAGGQWNTVERVAALSEVGQNDHSVALAGEGKAVFFIRDGQIHEGIWLGEEPTELALIVRHDELDAIPLDAKVGLWVSPDASQVWFDSNRSGSHQVYRAVRAAPTAALAPPASGGRMRHVPIR